MHNSVNVLGAAELYVHLKMVKKFYVYFTTIDIFIKYLKIKNKKPMTGGKKDHGRKGKALYLVPLMMLFSCFLSKGFCIFILY